ncbi:hypothetical protein Tco_1369702 [Tanacetum coccineum]
MMSESGCITRGGHYARGRNTPGLYYAASQLGDVSELVSEPRLPPLPDYHTWPRGSHSLNTIPEPRGAHHSPLDFVPEPMYPEDDDDDDDDEDEDEDEEEEEEHPAPADSVPPVHRMTARISIRDEPSISLPPREEVERLLALTTLPTITTYTTIILYQYTSPPFLASPPARSYSPLGYSGCYDSGKEPRTIHPSHPLPTTTSITLLTVYYLLTTGKTRPEITLPPRKRLGIDIGPRYELIESSAAAATRPIGGRRIDYGFVDPREAIEEVAPMTLGGVNTRVTELTAVQEQDTQDIYAVIEDTQDRQTQIYQSVGTLVDDSQYHYETARLLDQEALVSREAWGRSIGGFSYMDTFRDLGITFCSDGSAGSDFTVAGS